MPDLVDRLVSHRTLGAAPREQLIWIAARAEERRFSAGETVVVRGAPIEDLQIVLAGRLSIRVNRVGGVTRELEWREGDVTGLLPYSRLTYALGQVVADEPSEVAFVHRRHFPAMIRECHEVTSILVHVMLDRARFFTSSDLQNEKLLALGRLAAGLAHELNNPASAVVRTAGKLAAGVAEAERAFHALGRAGLSVEQAEALAAAREACAVAALTVVRSSLERADREDAVTSWLEEHGVDPSLAEPLAESIGDPRELDDVARLVGSGPLEVALRAHAAACSTRRLVAEIESASARIHGLVAAVKGFTYMDQAAAPKPVDIGQGLSDTLTVLQAKARRKAAGVVLQVAPDLPRIQAFGGELNQIWLNLIDNALDAVPEGGQVHVTAERAGDTLVVRVIDNGPGIPDELRARIFEPFFTTKPPGEGTGLGLDVVRRLVAHHAGDVHVSSQPGRTEFRVTLPVAGAPY